MRFTKEFLFDADLIDETIDGKTRWQTQFHAYVEHEGKFYRVDWQRGSTESQDDGMEFEVESDGLIDCPEAHLVEKTVKVWELKE